MIDWLVGNIYSTSIGKLHREKHHLAEVWCCTKGPSGRIVWSQLDVSVAQRPAMLPISGRIDGRLLRCYRVLSYLFAASMADVNQVSILFF